MLETYFRRYLWIKCVFLLLFTLVFVVDLTNLEWASPTVIALTTILPPVFWLPILIPQLTLTLLTIIFRNNTVLQKLDRVTSFSLFLAILVTFIVGQIRSDSYNPMGIAVYGFITSVAFILLDCPVIRE